MVETHPFGIFIPQNARYLVLGSFIAKRKGLENTYNWFYGKKRNQFWPILESVYKIKLDTKKAKQKLFTNLSIAITDIILSCERKFDNSMDSSLVNCTYNTKAIKKLLSENKIEKILFTSRFVENEFKKHFNAIISKYPKIELKTLPSPSPRYAAMSKEEKIKRYFQIFPKLHILVEN